MYTIRACIFFKTFSASLGTGLFLDKVVPDSTMSTFQTHTGTAFRAAQRDGFHISIKRGGRRRGGKGPSSGESGPSGTMNRFEWSICFSLLPPLFITIEDTGVVERAGSPLNTFF